MLEKVLEVRVSELMPGDILAADVLKANGSVLVKKDTEITEGIMEGLRKNYEGSLYVYRKMDDLRKGISVNIEEIIINECEEIINFSILKYLKKNKNINEIKKVILDVLKSTRVMELMIELRALGESTFKHSVSVAVYSVAVGKEMNFPLHRLLILGTAGLLHDIGMLRVGKDIVNRDGSLTDEEKETIKKHPKLGFDILNEKSNFTAEISNIVLQHHERYDGTGYPNKIPNEKIHVMSKIIGICDVYEALTSDRPYRRKFRRSDTIEYLLGTGNYYFNHEIIQALIDTIIIYPYGQWVELNNGESGVVIEKEDITSFNIRPSIMIYFDKAGNKLKPPKLVDLSLREHSSLLIERLI